jgi:hypothetical protein
MNSYDCRELMNANRCSSLRSFHAAERAGLTTALHSDESPERERTLRSWFGHFSRRAAATSPSPVAARQSAVPQ